jgi:pimeloyl-ACP methyl ester carboxylesterase
MGDKDVICSPKNGDVLAEKITESSLVKFPSATHFAHLEETEKFSRVLNSYLA